MLTVLGATAISTEARFHELLSLGLKACVAHRNVPSARDSAVEKPPGMKQRGESPAGNP